MRKLMFQCLRCGRAFEREPERCFVCGYKPRIIRLERVGWSDFRPLARGVPGAMAWTRGDVVYVRRGAERFLFGLARVGHELEHCLEGMTNDDHHPWWHFCIRAFCPVRFWWHVSPETRTRARILREVGVYHVEAR